MEQFLSLPCFDYSTVTLLPPPRSSAGASADDKEEASHGPPKRAPVTVEETVLLSLSCHLRLNSHHIPQLSHYKNLVKAFFQVKRPSASSGSSQLQRDASPLTRSLLSGIFSRHNRQLAELLVRYRMDAQARDVETLGWDI